MLAFIWSGGPIVVKPSKSNRNNPWAYDLESYQRRNLIERVFNKLRHWRGIATPQDQRGFYFLASLHRASPVIWPAYFSNLRGNPGRLGHIPTKPSRGRTSSAMSPAPLELAPPRAEAATGAGISLLCTGRDGCSYRGRIYWPSGHGYRR